MKYTSISLKDAFSSDNMRSCMSAKRALKICFSCDKYDNCESKIVNPEYDRLVNEKKKLYEKIDIINEQIATIGS